MLKKKKKIFFFLTFRLKTGRSLYNLSAYIIGCSRSVSEAYVFSVIDDEYPHPSLMNFCCA
jgi:hypothetical protein